MFYRETGLKDKSEYDQREILKPNKNSIDTDIEAFKIPYLEYYPLLFDGCSSFVIVFLSLFSLMVIILFSLYIGTLEKTFYDGVVQKTFDASKQGRPVPNCYTGITSACAIEGALRPIDLSNSY